MGRVVVGQTEQIKANTLVSLWAAVMTSEAADTCRAVSRWCSLHYFCRCFILLTAWQLSPTPTCLHHVWICTPSYVFLCVLSLLDLFLWLLYPNVFAETVLTLVLLKDGVSPGRWFCLCQYVYKCFVLIGIVSYSMRSKMTEISRLTAELFLWLDGQRPRS